MPELRNRGHDVTGGEGLRGAIPLLEVPGAVQHQAGGQQADGVRAADRGGAGEDTGDRGDKEEDGEGVRGEGKGRVVRTNLAN